MQFLNQDTKKITNLLSLELGASKIEPYVIDNDEPGGRIYQYTSYLWCEYHTHWYCHDIVRHHKVISQYI